MSPHTPSPIRRLAQFLPSRGIFVAFALMFTSSYLDNLRGIIMPLLSKELGINYDAASWLLGLGNISAVLVATGLLAFLKRFSLKSALFLAVFGMMGVVIGAPLVRDYHSFLTFAFVLGGLLTAIGTVSSLTIMREVRGPKLASTLSLLHVMYGAGSLMAPAVAAGLLKTGWHWEGLMRLSLVGLALCAILSVNKDRDHSPQPSQSAGPGSAHGTEGSKALGLLLLLTFATYVAGEVVGSMWLTTYLVESHRMSVEGAAPYVSGFFVLMAVTRTVTFFVRTQRMQTALLAGCLVAALVSFCLGLSGILWGLSGLGLLGPFYPLFMSRITRVFPATWQRLTIWAIISMQLALMMSHWVVGETVAHYGTSIAFTFPAIMIFATLCLTLLYLRQERRQVT